MNNAGTQNATKKSRSQRRKARKNAEKMVASTPSAPLAKPTRTVQRAAAKAAIKSVENGLITEFSRERIAKDRDIGRILQSVCAPRAFPPVRLGAGVGSYQTATANPQEAVKATFVVNSLQAFLFRDPLRFFVHRVISADQTLYSVTFGGGETINTHATSLVSSRMGYISGTKDHGDFVYPGRFHGEGKSFFPVSQFQLLEFNNLTAATTYTFTPVVYKVDGSFDTLAPVTAAPQALTTLYSNVTYDHVYVGFTVQVSTGTALLIGALRLKTNGLIKVWAHRSLPSVSQNLTAAEAVKIYGLSMMFTNTASPLHRQGKLAAVQVPQGEDWRDLTTYDSISGIKDVYRDEAVDGYYGFLRSTQTHDLDYIESWEVTNGALTLAWFEMDSKSDFLALSVECTDADGQDGYLTIDAALEYRTDDQWREVRPPTISSVVVLEAFELIPNLKQHHKNAFHMSDITGFIGRTLSNLWTGAKWAFPKVAKGLQIANEVATMAAPFFV